MSTIANLKINIITSTRGMEKGLRRASKSVAKFRKGLNKTFGGAARMGFVAAAAGVAILTLALKKVITTFAAFEFQMQEVRSILLDITDRTFARLEAMARKLGATTVFTASEAGAAMSFLARAGFDVNEVMAATPALLDLAAAANMNLAEAADITSQVIRGMGLEASEAGRVVDVLAFASARTNTTVQQLGHAFGYVAPVASALGITLEETAAMLGVLSNAGMQADRAGTGLKNIFAELAGEIDRHGIKALKKFTEGGIGVEKAFDIFQKRGGPAILALAKMHKITEKLVREMQDVEGVARKMADIRMDSVQGAFKLLASVVQELNIMIGERLRGTIRNIQEVLRKFVVGFTATFKVLIEKMNLSKFSVENMVKAIRGIIKWVEKVWDKISRIASLVMSVIHTIIHALLEGIGLAMRFFDDFIVFGIKGLEILGLVADGTAKHLSTVFQEAYKEMTRQTKYHSEAAATQFDKVFEETSKAATRFVDDLIKEMQRAGKTPIILTVQLNVLRVTVPEDVAKVEKSIEDQIKAAQMIEDRELQGRDRGDIKTRAVSGMARLEDLVSGYRGASKKIEHETNVLNRLINDERKMKEELSKVHRGGYDTGSIEREKALLILIKERGEMIDKQGEKVRTAHDLRDQYDRGEAMAAGERYDRFVLLLRIMENVDRLKSMKVVGPPSKEFSELKDVEADLEILYERMEEMKNMPLGSMDVSKMTHDLAMLVAEIEELENKKEDLSKPFVFDVQNPLEEMRTIRKNLETDLKKQQESTMGVFGDSFDGITMPGFGSIDPALVKELEEIGYKLADLETARKNLNITDTELQLDTTQLDKTVADIKELEKRRDALGSKMDNFNINLEENWDKQWDLEAQMEVQVNDTQWWELTDEMDRLGAEKSAIWVEAIVHRTEMDELIAEIEELETQKTAIELERTLKTIHTAEFDVDTTQIDKLSAEIEKLKAQADAVGIEASVDFTEYDKLVATLDKLQIQRDGLDLGLEFDTTQMEKYVAESLAIWEQQEPLWWAVDELEFGPEMDEMDRKIDELQKLRDAIDEKFQVVIPQDEIDKLVGGVEELERQQEALRVEFIVDEEAMDKLVAEIEELETQKTAIEIEFQVDEGIYEDLKKRKKELEGMGVLTGTGISLDMVNAEIEQYLEVFNKAERGHDAMVEVRGKWMDIDKISEARGELEESIADNELLAKTIGMTSREKEIFIAKTQGVSQALLDEATALDTLLTQKEADLVKQEELEASATKMKEAIKTPLDVYTESMDDLDKMLKQGMLTMKQHDLSKKQVESELHKARAQDAKDSVVGIQTALGTFKVASGATGIQQKQHTTQQKQHTTQKSQLQQQTQTVKVLKRIDKNLKGGKALQ